MQESETDKILLSNIAYLKQFISINMEGEIVILANSLISNLLQSLRHSAVVLIGEESLIKSSSALGERLFSTSLTLSGQTLLLSQHEWKELHSEFE